MRRRRTAARRSRMLARAVLTLVVSGLVVTPLAAQRPAVSAVSGFLPPNHWAADAARRLEALGATAGLDFGGRAIGIDELALVLHELSSGERRASPKVVELARSYALRLAEEYPRVGEFLPKFERRRVRVIGASIVGGFLERDGAVSTGSGYADTPGDPPPVPPVPRRDYSRLVGGGAATVALLSFVGVHADAIAGADQWQLREAYGIGSWRKLGAWAGRRAIGYGYGDGGGIVLSGEVPFDGAGVFLTAPVVLPWILRYVGPVRFESFLSRVHGVPSAPHPWFWSARGTVAPHPRLTLAANRGAMFGGNQRINGLALFQLLVGRHADGSAFENQVVSVEARYNLPLRAMPATLYVEWGFEDSAGAWRDEPGVLAGVFVPAVPGAPTVSLGVESVAIFESCCGNPRWYRHWLFSQGWTERGVPLGHPLGGRGTEWRLYAHGDLLDARLRLRGAALYRERGVENLYYPVRDGRSVGGTARAELRARSRADLVGAGSFETGRGGWRESSAMLGMRLLF